MKLLMTSQTRLKVVVNTLIECGCKFDVAPVVTATKPVDEWTVSYDVAYEEKVMKALEPFAKDVFTKFTEKHKTTQDTATQMLRSFMLARLERPEAVGERAATDEITYVLRRVLELAGDLLKDAWAQESD